MTQVTLSSPPRRPRHLRRLAQFAVLLLIFADLIVMLVAYFNYRNQQRLATIIANLDETDPGWRWADIMARRRDVPDAENSALLVLEAAKGLPPGWPAGAMTNRDRYFHSDITDQRQGQSAQLGPDRISALRAELAKVTAAVEAARGVAKLPYGRFAFDDNPNKFGIVLSNIEPCCNVANLLWYDTLLRAQDGDPDGALTSAQAMINVARSVGDEPLLVSTLVRMGNRVHGLRAIERTLAHEQPSNARLTELQALLIQEASESLAITSIRGERAAVDDLLQAIAAGQISQKWLRELAKSGRRPAAWSMKAAADAVEEWLESVMGPSIGSIPANRAAMLEYNVKALAIAQLRPEQQDPAIQKLEATVPGEPRFVRAMAPAYSKVLAADRRGLAELRCAIVGLAAERFRREYGRWPSALSELTPRFLDEVPLDPFDGAPLRYAPTPDGMVIYSIGPDGKDNGGNVNRTMGGSTPGVDLGFWLFDVDKRRQGPLPAMPKDE